jgi:hypothetical protein
LVSQSSETYIQSLFADRIGGPMFGKETKIYKFEKIKRAKRAAMAAHPGVPLIDLGVGEPDEMAFPGVVKRLQKEAEKPENRGYADNGIQEFKAAAARYLSRVYGVKGINPETEVLHGIGSKPVLAMLPSIFINPGDVTLMTVPGYPVMATHTRWYGGSVHALPAGPGRGPRRCPEEGKAPLPQLSQQSDRSGRHEGLLREGRAVREGEQYYRGPGRRLRRADVRIEAALVPFHPWRKRCGRRDPFALKGL